MSFFESIGSQSTTSSYSEEISLEDIPFTNFRMTHRPATRSASSPSDFASQGCPLMEDIEGELDFIEKRLLRIKKIRELTVLVEDSSSDEEPMPMWIEKGMMLGSIDSPLKSDLEHMTIYEEVERRICSLEDRLRGGFAGYDETGVLLSKRDFDRLEKINKILADSVFSTRGCQLRHSWGFHHYSSGSYPFIFNLNSKAQRILLFLSQFQEDLKTLSSAGKSYQPVYVVGLNKRKILATLPGLENLKAFDKIVAYAKGMFLGLTLYTEREALSEYLEARIETFNDIIPSLSILDQNKLAFWHSDQEGVRYVDSRQESHRMIQNIRAIYGKAFKWIHVQNHYLDGYLVRLLRKELYQEGRHILRTRGRPSDMLNEALKEFSYASYPKTLPERYISAITEANLPVRKFISWLKTCNSKEGMANVLLERKSFGDIYAVDLPGREFSCVFSENGVSTEASPEKLLDIGKSILLLPKKIRLSRHYRIAHRALEFSARKFSELFPPRAAGEDEDILGYRPDKSLARCVYSLIMDYISYNEGHPFHRMKETITEKIRFMPDQNMGAFFNGFAGIGLVDGTIHGNIKILKDPIRQEICREVVVLDFKLELHEKEQLEKRKELFWRVIGRNDIYDTIHFSREGPLSYSKPTESGRWTRHGDTPIKSFFAGKGFGTAETFVVTYTKVGRVAGRVVIPTQTSEHPELNDQFNRFTLSDRITVEIWHDDHRPGAQLSALHKMLVPLGLSTILHQRDPINSLMDEREIILSLMKAFYTHNWKLNPTETISVRDQDLASMDVANLRKKIEKEMPPMREIFRHYLDQNRNLISREEIYPSYSVWSIGDMDIRMKEAGAVGLMMGYGLDYYYRHDGREADTRREGKGPRDIADMVFNILAKGALSSQDRFDAGINKKGGSTDADHQSGGADGVFTRLVTRDLLSSGDMTPTGTTVEQRVDYAGEVQFLIDLSICRRGGYCNSEDTFGATNRYDRSNGERYVKRSNFIETTRLLNDLVERQKIKTNGINNEFIFKNRIPPEFIIGVVVQNDEYRVRIIEKLHSEGMIVQEENELFVLAAGKKYPLDQFIYVSNRFEERFWEK